MRHEIVLTEDGSPTYRQFNAVGSEDMHNSSGAFSETLIIYGPIIAACFEQRQKTGSIKGPHFMSLGLGLGYNEVLIACMAISAGRRRLQGEALHLTSEASEWTCHSYEKEAWLVQDLLAFLGAENEVRQELTSEKKLVYQKIFSVFSTQFAITEERLRTELLLAYKEKRWIIEPEFCYQLPKKDVRFHAYLWDAFSRKTDPELWELSKLENYLKATQAPSAFFATYACFRDLKTALTQAHFQWKVRKAQTRKRESLIAWRDEHSEEILNAHLPEQTPKTSSHTL